MANKRCFSKDVIDTDAFLEMPCSAQNLYFHIGMRSDDDGFCSSPIKIIKLVNASVDDLKILINKKFLLQANDGVVVVKHWWIHNTKRKDTYKQSNYLIHNKNIRIDENKVYTYNTDDSSRYLSVNEPLTQIKLNKIKENKDNVSNNNTHACEKNDDLNNSNVENSHINDDEMEEILGMFDKN